MISAIIACQYNAAYANELPYDTYNYNYYEDIVYTPAAYVPSRSISGTQLTYEGKTLGVFSKPGDLCKNPKGEVVIADTGNNRIVKFNNRVEDTTYVVKQLDPYVKHMYNASGRLQLTTNTFPAMAIETDGTNFYISDLYTSNIVKFNSSWVEASTPVAVYGSEVGNVKFPKGMLVLIDEEKMYVADTMSGEIEEFTLV